MSSLVDDINKFCKDLVLGDFEQQPGNAAMIVGGLISLVPVADQIMDVRDVSGMIYRINYKGTKQASQDDWVDLSLAAFGCIPEVGSLFKTIIKPLWKNRATWRVGQQGGQAMIEAMQGLKKGSAITYLKTFNWAARTRQAVEQTNNAFTLCDQFLGELAQPHWWIPDSLEGLARDMRPQLSRVRGPVNQGVQAGAKALQQFVLELLGEDALAVANMAAASTNNLGGSRATKRSRNNTSQRAHQPIADSHVQKQEKKSGPASFTQRATRKGWEDLKTRHRGLLGEHMAHYLYMKKTAANYHHGRFNGEWSTPAQLVTEQNKPHTPTELIAEHLARVNQSGVDGVWSLGNHQFHFVEAKAYQSAGQMFGAASHWHDAEGQADGKRKKKLAPPANLTEREVALWYMLGQPRKGLQMSRKWLEATVIKEMRGPNNLQNRFVYVFFGIPSDSGPKNYTPKPGPKLKKGSTQAIVEHITASAMLLADNAHDEKAHDAHDNDHMYSDMFTAAEIDQVDEFYKKARKNLAGKASPTQDSAAQPTPDKPPKQTNRSTRGRGK